MRIFLAHNYYRSSAPSGEDIAYANEKRMLEEGCIDIQTYEKFNDDLENLNTFNKIKLGISNSWSSNTFDEVKSILKKTKPDLAHFHNTFPQITPSAYAACKEMGVPVVQTLHNFRLLCANALLMRDGKTCELCLSGSLRPALKYKCYRNSLVATTSQVLCIKRNRLNGSYFNNVNRYIALTDFSTRKFIQAGFPRELFTMRPNFLPDPPPLSNNHQAYALFVGRITGEKGVLTLLKAWRKIKHYTLKIVGSGNLLASFKEYAAAQDLNVEFTGYLPRAETISMIQNARFMILPSECYEGFPMVLLEAFACGTPLLVSNIGGQSEIVEDDVTGRHFSVGDNEDLAKKCIELIESDELIGKIKVNARTEFEKKYTKESVLEKTLEIYNSILH